MKISEIINILNDLAPLNYAEDFDNVGLLVGQKNEDVSGILVTLDTTEEVVDEAIEKNCNLIVSFHPIIFKGLKKLNGNNYVERVVIKAVKHDISIFAIHTALDNSIIGVNDIICEKLGLENRKILIPQTNTIKKLTTYVPVKDAENLKQRLFAAGAGRIGNYEDCSFAVEGFGTYKGNEDSNPTIGNKHEMHTEKETQISITFLSHLENRVVSALKEHHPYEEVAYEITTLDNKNQNIGMGMVGELPHPITTGEFLSEVCEKMNCSVIRHSAITTDKIKKVAVLGGSGSFAIDNAIGAGVDIYLTADLKYHDFFRAEGKIILADIGHYESEQFTKTFLTDYLSKKITNFAVVLSTTQTNPVKYFKYGKES